MYFSILLALTTLIGPVCLLMYDQSWGSLNDISAIIKSSHHSISESKKLAEELLFIENTQEIQKIKKTILEAAALKHSMRYPTHQETPFLLSELTPSSCIAISNHTFLVSEGALRSKSYCELHTLIDKTAMIENIYAEDLISLSNASLLSSLGSIYLKKFTLQTRKLIILAGGDITIEKIVAPLSSDIWLISGTGKIIVRAISGRVAINPIGRTAPSLPDHTEIFNTPPNLRRGSLILSLRPIASPEDPN